LKVDQIIEGGVKHI